MSGFRTPHKLVDGDLVMDVAAYPYSFETECDDTFKIEMAFMDFERDSEVEHEFGEWTAELIYDQADFTGTMRLYFKSEQDATMARLIL